MTATSRNSNDFSNGDEETDCDEISRPSPPPPKRRNKRSQERTSDSSESLSPKTESASCRTRYSFIFFLSCQQRTLLEQDDKRVQKFITFVDKALVLFTSPSKFSLDFAYEPRFAPNVNLWIRLAMQKNVEELELNLQSLCETAIARILSGSPVLEFLELYECRIEVSLNINSQSLKKLVIWDCSNPYYEGEFEISAPNVSGKILRFSRRKKKIRLVNKLSLSDAKLDFDPIDLDRLPNLLLSTRHVKDLTLGFRCIQVGLQSSLFSFYAHVVF
ncbi:hypothetical protein F0562_018408 [Nyssa sinensis]|uniref:F-box/LRR-repeat protein 15/At3g58940/PEG3-like LRR domain-containing protein n=1 Tax=Nyssa sinensis TaxID=561372 RepID=A0A5J4ZC52_9ASTE|nr:hypothetical protein F0562_018408 [Nyssa sinensis]